MIRVLLVDDHTSVRQARSIVFERESDCTVVAQAGSLGAARETLTDDGVAVEAGASGVLHKSVKLSETIGMMRRLDSGGQIHTSEELIDLLRLASPQREQERDAKAALARLTPREREVLYRLHWHSAGRFVGATTPGRPDNTARVVARSGG